MKRILIVAATVKGRESFRHETHLGRSLARLSSDTLVESAITCLNFDGLPKVFNRSISRARRDYILVFTHDDVSLDDSDLAAALNEAAARFAVVGVAGNRRRLPRQPAWAFTDESLSWDEAVNLSGRVAHFTARGRRVSEYGPTPRECRILDGAFLAADAAALLESGVRFDERFDFHFYDLDFCRSAELAGLRMGTWPVALTHQSGGAFGGPEWRRQLNLYRDKWGD